jgi:hypothetical protein
MYDLLVDEYNFDYYYYCCYYFGIGDDCIVDVVAVVVGKYDVVW